MKEKLYIRKTKDSDICYQLAGLSETDEVMRFIHDYWNESHIYANDKEFFLYEFEQEDYLSIITARDHNNDLIGIYAFYIYSYDVDGNVMDVGGGLSKVRTDCRIPLVGIGLYEAIRKIIEPRVIISVGMDKNTSYVINKTYFKNDVGVMSHYYRLSDREDYKIALVNDKAILPVKRLTKQMVLIPVDEKAIGIFYSKNDYSYRMPYRSYDYILHRYFNHPIYKYLCYGIEDKMVLICRAVSHNGATVLRIVDILGDVSYLRFASNGLQGLMLNNDYEYVDCMAYGLDERIMIDAGFKKRDENDRNIIPNYFEPYVCENIDIFCSVTKQGCLIFKADADQDRPNRR